MGLLRNLAAATLAVVWKAGEPKVAGLLTINGKSFPAADLNAAALAVLNGIRSGKDARSIAVDLGPSALALVEDAANMVFPGAGTAVEVIAFMIEHARPMTRDEEELFFKRVQGAS